MKFDYRLPVLIAVLAVASAYYNVTRRAVPPGITQEEHFKRAEELHSKILREDGSIDKNKVREALAEYKLALDASDLRLSAKSHIGAGQMNILEGDTSAAIAEWKNVSVILPGDFEALRAMKSIADAMKENGQKEDAKEWYKKIVSEFGDSKLPQAMEVIVNSTRKEMN